MSVCLSALSPSSKHTHTHNTNSPPTFHHVPFISFPFPLLCHIHYTYLGTLLLYKDFFSLIIIIVVRSVGHSFSRKKKLAALIFPFPPSPSAIRHPPSAIRHPFSVRDITILT